MIVTISFVALAILALAVRGIDDSSRYFDARLKDFQPLLVVDMLPESFIARLRAGWKREQQKGEEKPLHSYVLCYLAGVRQQNLALSTAVAKRKRAACNRQPASVRRLATRIPECFRKSSTAYAPSGWYDPKR